ncbi:uncharacterized protein [Paramisgurnus dabryanus]|uniref:uncharacterized protein n=1 Tax=Paramisgurnus dabryanus TaxID=90735 RepID=UPI003CCFB799
MIFMFVFLSFCFTSLVGVFSDEVKSVMEGDSFTLNADTEIKSQDVISWSFGSNGTLIAKINKAAKTTKTYTDDFDGRFRDRLQLNDQTGDLIITNITTQHTGLYQLIISGRSNALTKQFNVIVYVLIFIFVLLCFPAHLPVPDIKRDCTKNSVSKCVLLCSVLNVRDVSLSWYKGNSLLSSISVSDLNIRLSLPLEVEYQDNNTYRCVLNNTITNQTQHLNINDICQSCSDCFCCCYGPEAVIRLVVSGLVGVATVAVLVHDIYGISCRDEKKKKSQTP